MQEPDIYDSQGVPLDADGPGHVNERIKSFFFAGVRFALSRSGGAFEIICFFRGRDSEVSRANQYYAVLESTTLRDFQDLQNTISRYVSDEYGITVDTTSGDDRFFEIFGSSPQSPPGAESTRQDIIDIVENGNQATLGVGSYEDAYAIFHELVGEVKTREFVIADNGSHSSVSDYTVAIEIGDYSGLELLGDTKNTIEQMKERRRQRQRSQMHAGGGDPYGNATKNSIHPGELLAIVGVVGIGILLIGSYSLCLIGGVAMPFIGDLPGATCGPADSVNNIDIDTFRWQDAGFSVSGTLMADGSPFEGANHTNVSFRLVSENDTVVDESQEVSLEGGMFETLIPSDNTSIDRTEISELIVEWNGTAERLNISSLDTGTRTQTPNSTPTPTPSATPESTQTATATSTPSTDTTVGGTETQTPSSE